MRRRKLEMHIKRYSPELFLSLIFLLFTLSPTLRIYAEPDAFGMSLEELMQIEVVSAAKKPQQLNEIPAAVFVINEDDIKRSGASNIPELLRMAPGVQVLEISNNKWAISIRGGAREYSNKLLVLVDGRSVYSPTFSGVFWEALDIPVELIERIEIVRGPGASIWGANAVNGVINILTKPAKVTQGALHNVYAGDTLKISSLLSYGWKVNNESYMRTHIKGLNVNQSKQPGIARGEDALKNFNAGFRYDKELEDYKFMLKGNLFTSSADDQANLFSSPPAVENKLFSQNFSGFNLVANWDLKKNPRRETSIQTSIESTNLDHSFIKEKRTTFDFDFQQRLKPHLKHDFIWGISGRLSLDDITSTKHMIVDESEKLTSQYRLYFNDEISLTPKKWTMTISGMLEHNDYTGFEFQPSLRFVYTPNQSNSIWWALSKGVRTPSRIERGSIYYPLADPLAAPLPFVVETILRDFDSERVDSLDVGWRKKFSDQLSLDLTGFYNKYRNLSGSHQISITPVIPPGYLITRFQLDNRVSAEVRGVEASIEWQPSNRAKLYGTYSLLKIGLAKDPEVLFGDVNKNVPVHMASLRAKLDLSKKLQWDSWIRYQSSIETGNLKGYTSLDTRIGYRLSKNLNASLVIQNLFDLEHKDFFPEILLSQVREVGRKTYLKLEWNY